ncbi:DMT family transporter [Urbifossiella limnaea]|uniref:EamA-like transporter family protein n=1 Tax=Urbifossiella limnaea TaxID=2528023 RepID=A0A517XT98_9BACT|nr:DMT family transporter [Urbifossiella limnaea]QDU20750.1 EamA-like transporter family protein [Urbifossiella limnaea]
MTRPDARPYLWMLSGSFSFTLMAEFAHVLTRECDWQLVAVARAGLVAVLAAVIAGVAGARLVFWPWRLWVRSVAGSCSMVCTFYAFAKLPAADVLTLTNTFPIWVAVLSWPLYGRPPGVKMLLAIGVGISGVVLVEQPHLESGNPGVYSALAAALLTAVAMLGLHSLKGIDPRAIVVHFSSVATVVCVAAYFVGPVERDPAGVAEPGVLLKLAGMAVTATVGQLFLTLAFGGGAPAKVSVVGLSQIVMGLAFDAWLWGREVNAVALVGTALVIAPTAWLLILEANWGASAPHPADAAHTRVPK